jgi:hypothetical protein
MSTRSHRIACRTRLTDGCWRRRHGGKRLRRDVSRLSQWLRLSIQHSPSSPRLPARSFRSRSSACAINKVLDQWASVRRSTAAQRHRSGFFGPRPEHIRKAGKRWDTATPLSVVTAGPSPIVRPRPPNTQNIIPPPSLTHSFSISSSENNRSLATSIYRVSSSAPSERALHSFELRPSLVGRSGHRQNPHSTIHSLTTSNLERLHAPSQPSVFNSFTTPRHCNFPASAPQLAPVSCSTFTRAGSRCHSRPKANSRNEKRVGLLSLRAKNQGRDRPNASIK